MENVPDMSDEDGAMSGHAVDALSSNGHDNGEPVTGADGPANGKNIGGQALNNVNGEAGAFAPPRAKFMNDDEYKAHCIKHIRHAKDRGTK